MMYNVESITNEIKKGAMPTENKCDINSLLETLTAAYRKSRHAVVAFIASLDESSVKTEDWHMLLQVAANLIEISVCTLLEFTSDAEHKMFIPDDKWQDEIEMQNLMQAMAKEKEAENQTELAAMLENGEIPDCDDYPDDVIDALMHRGCPIEEDDPAWLQ